MILRPRIGKLRDWLACIDRFLIASNAYTRHSDVVHMAELSACLGQLEHATASTARLCCLGAEPSQGRRQPHRRRREQLRLDLEEVLLRVHAVVETAGVLTRDDASHWNAGELSRRNGLLGEAVEAFRSGPALGSWELAWLLEFSTRYIAKLANGGQLPVADPGDRTPAGRLRVRVARGFIFAAQAQGPENNLGESACIARVEQ